METRASLGRLGHHLLPPHCLGQHATSPLGGAGRFALFAPLGLLSGPWAWLSQTFRRSALEIIQAHLSLLASATSALPLQHLLEPCSTQSRMGVLALQDGEHPIWLTPWLGHYWSDYSSELPSLRHYHFIHEVGLILYVIDFKTPIFTL